MYITDRANANPDGALAKVPSGSINDQKARFFMSTGDTNDPQHWRERAAQMRALAVKMGDTEAAILMRDLAADYEKLAERAEIRTKGKKPRSNGRPR
jgi:hypothetical protein